MPRKGSVPKRKITLDSKYNDIVVSKFLNSLMYDGKKSTAEKILYGAMDIVAEKSGKE